MSGINPGDEVGRPFIFSLAMILTFYWSETRIRVVRGHFCGLNLRRLFTEAGFVARDIRLQCAE